MNCRTGIGLPLFLGLSGASFGSEVGDPFNLLGIKITDGSQWQYDFSSGFRFGDLDQLELGETDIDRILQHFSRLKQIFGSNPLLDDPHMRITELKANCTWLSPLVNLNPEERRNKLEEKRVTLCQKYEKRKQVAANPEMKKI